MRARHVAVVVTLLAAVGGLTVAEAAPRSSRPLVAVMDFDYGTVDHWWGNYDVGKGMADQVMDELVNDGTFRVVERKKLDAVLAEQDFAMSDRADPSAAKLARMGKVLGVKYIIAGSITKYSIDRKRGGLRLRGVRLGGGKAKASVNLTARMIDTTTGEILISAKGAGVSKRGTGLDFGKGGVGFNMGTPEFRDSALGDAQEAACKELVEQLAARADRLGN